LTSTVLREITLTTQQMEEAAAVARRLHNNLRRRGVRDAHGLRARDATAELEAGGAQAELAASLLLGVPWTAGRSADKYGPDIGTRTQVRSSNKPRSSHCLIVRPRDIEKYGNVPFVLVIQAGRLFRIHGWTMALDAATDEFRWDGGDRQRPEAWFVPEAKLLPIDTLEGV
jgi:hypothetical protein